MSNLNPIAKVILSIVLVWRYWVLRRDPFAQLLYRSLTYRQGTWILETKAGEERLFQSLKRATDMGLFFGLQLESDTATQALKVFKDQLTEAEKKALWLITKTTQPMSALPDNTLEL